MILMKNQAMESAFCLEPGASLKTSEKSGANPFELFGGNVLQKFEIMS